MKTIVVPVDFSKYSEFALEVAANIIKKQGGKIIALHMMGLSDSALDTNQQNKIFNRIKYLELTKERFSEFLNKEFLKGVEVEDTITNYKIFSEISTIAEDMGADLIVMGSHGVTGFKDVFVGSNTEKVVRTSAIPVLVVKNHVPEFNLKNVVFATDFNSENIPAYHKARRFLNQFGAEPQLLFVNLPSKFLSTQEMKAMALKFLSDAKVENPNLYDQVHFYNDYTLEGGVYRFSREQKVDLIITATHGRRGLAHFFMGSGAEDISNTSEIPVLTIKIEK